MIILDVVRNFSFQEMRGIIVLLTEFHQGELPLARDTGNESAKPTACRDGGVSVNHRDFRVWHVARLPQMSCAGPVIWQRNLLVLASQVSTANRRDAATILGRVGGNFKVACRVLSGIKRTG